VSEPDRGEATNSQSVAQKRLRETSRLHGRVLCSELKSSDVATLGVVADRGSAKGRLERPGNARLKE
jgi:hypothetical protein